MKSRIIIFTYFILLCNVIFAQYLRLPSIFSDNMVLQRNKPICVWGTCKPHDNVRILLENKEVNCTADSEGNWKTYLPSFEAGGPFIFSVFSGDEKIELKDVYVGEVWLASGQSNMAWKISNGVGDSTEIVKSGAKYPLIRFYNSKHETHISPIKKWERHSWDICSPETVGEFSAVAYFFARELYKDLKVPVGVISASWGATSIEAWMNPEILKGYDKYSQWFDELDTDSVKWQKKVEESVNNDKMRDVITRNAKIGYDKRVYKSNYDDSDWSIVNNPVNTSNMKLNDYWGITWLRTDFNLDKKIKEDLYLDGDINVQNLDVWLNGKKLIKKEGRLLLSSSSLKKNNTLAFRVVIHWGSAYLGTEAEPMKLVNKDNSIIIPLDNKWKFNSTMEPKLPGWQNYYNTHTVLYNAMIYPLMPFTMQGVIWYQGENNAGYAKRYKDLLPMMIQDWRVGFSQGYLPFITVQLANYMKKNDQPTESAWAELREAQAMSLKLPKCGLVVTIDIGEENNIHPQNKLDVGRRLLKQAKYLAYGGNIEYSGPEFDYYEVEDSVIKVFFKHAKGLHAKGSKVLGFTISGDDKKFYNADAVIYGNCIVVSSSKVSNPVALRYAWADNPDTNLYNEDNLPAIPFRTDDWEGITKN